MDEEEQEIVNIQVQKEYNIQQEDYRFEVDEEEQVNRKAQAQKEDNIQQEDNSCELDEEEQEIIPPYFQPLFWEDNSWYKLVRFEDYYRLPHIEDRIEKEKCWYGIKPPLGYIEHVRRERKKDKEIWLEKKLEGRLSPYEDWDSYGEEDEEEDDDEEIERGSIEEVDLGKYQENIIFLTQSNYMIKQDVRTRVLDYWRRQWYIMDYNYKLIEWRGRDFNIRLYDWCSLRIHDLHVPIWKVKKLKKNRYKTNRVFLHKRLKRLLSSLNLKRLIERKKEATRDQNIRDLTNPYIIPNMQLIHDVIITAKTGSEVMVMDEEKRSKSYGKVTNEQRTNNDNTKEGKETRQNMNNTKRKDWLATNMRGIFNKKPVDEGNVDIGDSSSPKAGDKYQDIHKKDCEEMGDDMKICGIPNEGSSWMNEMKEEMKEWRDFLTSKGLFKEIQEFDEFEAWLSDSLDGKKEGKSDKIGNENYCEKVDIALDCSTPMCDELNEHHSQREDSLEELDIQVKDLQEERVETLNKNQKKKRNRKIRMMNARKRAEIEQFSDFNVPSTKEEVKMEEVKLKGDTRIVIEQFSDCDLPSTKDEVKTKEVKLRGDTSYRYEGIPAFKVDTDGKCIDMKDQLECPYCGKIYPEQTHLKPHIEKIHKDLLEGMDKDEARALRWKKFIRKSQGKEC